MFISPAISLGSEDIALLCDFRKTHLEIIAVILQVFWKQTRVIQALASIIRLRTDVLWPLNCKISCETSVSGSVLLLHLQTMQTPKLHCVAKDRWIGNLWVCAMLYPVFPYSFDPEFAEASRHRSSVFEEILDVRCDWLRVAQVICLSVFVIFESGRQRGSPFWQ